MKIAKYLEYPKSLQAQHNTKLPFIVSSYL